MALKPDREIYQETIKYTCETTGEEGYVCVVTSGGSGVALGDRAGQASIVSNPSGYKVAGVLMHDVVDKDETLYHLNFHNGERKKGSHACLLRKGVITTDALVSATSPTDGATAYLGADGKFTPTLSATGGLVATPKMGEFKGSKDENGFVCVEVNLPA